MSGGGAEKIILNIAKELSNRGHDVDLVLVNATGPYMQNIPDCINIIDFGCSRTLYSLPKLVIYLRDESPDALLATLNHANLVAIWSKIISRTPSQLLIRQSDIPSKNTLDSKKEQVIHKLMRIFYPYSDEIIVMSNMGNEDLSSNYSINDDKISIIHNPVNVKNILEMKEESAGVPDFNSEFVISSAGRLAEEKDFSTLIESFYYLQQSLDVELVILGEGEKRDELEQLTNQLGIEEQVSFPGFVDNPYKYISRSDVFVLSSKWEGFGNVLVEALVCETAIVSTNCPGGPNEILQKGKYGKLVPVGDSEALAKAIQESLFSPIDKNHLQDRGMDFSIESKVDEYEQLLLES
ncbi:glycosyltransferase [Natrialba sp. SSL1]|uniref:glycosyltransferase n=1 Tax=Natrialba sp. SSL1 TaxID=1869245 RepID=UPI0014955556|nr:glycosyltransferase [Natrialba sp. SSL1]